MPIPLAIPIAMTAGGYIATAFQRAAANKALEQSLGRLPGVPKPMAKMAGMASTLLNARMPGAAQAERNINQTQANQIANAQRTSASSNDLLLAGAAAAGQAGQAYNQLQQQEAADYQRRYGNYVNAQQMDYQASIQDYQNRMQDMQNRMQIEGAINQNKQANWGDLSNLGMAGLNLAAAKPSMFGKGLWGGTGAGSSIDLTNPSTGMTSRSSLQTPNNFLSMGYGQQQPYNWFPSNALSQGYGQQPAYSWMNQGR
jgi:hypothetical protein